MKRALVSVVIVTTNRKKDLIECVDSYLKSTYKPLEIIVVDNASNPPIFTWFRKKYPKVKLITSAKNLGAAEGRNVGFKESKGKYILFTDDDAYAAKDMVFQLVKVFEANRKAGIVQPLVYDKDEKNLLQGAGHDFDLLTGRLTAWGVREYDEGQYEGLREVPMCGCVWMVARKVFNKIGLYDEDYFIPYEDSDFSIRARKAGFGLYCESNAKTYHQGPKKTYVHPRIEYLGITSAQRAYRTMRNKMIFMFKHSPFPKNIIFFVLIFPGYLIIHSIIIVTTGRFDIFLRYWLGVLSGFLYIISYPMRSFFPYYKKLDKKLQPIKYFFMAWEDPLVWILDKNSKTFLDLGCGDGKLMQLVKIRMKVKYSVGVDLFEPYINKAKSKKTHNKYILGDVTDLKIPKGSFDVVIASHIIEHLKKKEAWRLIEGIEKIAKHQVVISSPIGENYNPLVDANELQLHQSHFYPREFEKRGYKILKYGWRWLLGDNGLIEKTQSDVGNQLLFIFNLFLTPIYYLFQSTCDYVFVAYKNYENES